MIAESQITTQALTLKLNDRGPAVRVLQEQINRRFLKLKLSSLVTVAVNGVFGPQTLDAVKYLQCVAGLTVDGIVGPQTLNFIEYGVEGLPLLTHGSTGSSVRAVQDAILRSRISIQVDGIFGPDTEAKLKRFQTVFFITPDGIVGPKTWEFVVQVRLGSPPCAPLLPTN